MKCQTKRGKLEEIKTELLVIGVYETTKTPEKLKKIDEKLNKAITEAIEKKEFNGELKQLKLIGTLGTIGPKNILLVGLGKKEELTNEQLGKLSGQAAIFARDFCGIQEITSDMHNTEMKNTTKEQKIDAVVSGTILADYQYIKYRTQDKDKIKFLKTLSLVGEGIEEQIKKSKITAEAENYIRNLVNEPAMYLTPEKLAQKAKELEKLSEKIKVTIYDKKQIQETGLTGLLAVNEGSVNEPRFIIIEYNNGGKTKTALVGKGITFDSGGLDIKPAAYMTDMKSDMAGAATVLGIIKANAELNNKVNLVGVISSTENMPGKNAYKPGDIVKTYSGKTIEVLNTDAEGRVVLADALAYTEKNLKPNLIIDFATLTGACIVALGSVCAGILGTDEKTIQALKKSGEETGERVWQLPLWQEYLEQVKSDVADVANIGNIKGEAGAITAAAFLRNFVEKTPWVHLDIAGVAWLKEDREYTKKGGTGFGVRLITNFLEKHNLNDK